MIKTEISIPKNKPELEFPLLAKAMGSINPVVLFTDLTQGTVLIPSGRDHHSNIGENMTWAPCDDKKVWEILPKGTQITLTQI